MTPGEQALTRLGEELSRCAREGQPVDPETLAARLGVPVDLVRDYQAALGALEASGRQAPARCGPYQLRDELGRGGMGAVYRAWDERLGREVAIKLLHGVTSQVSLRRFRREADALARLDHPNLIRVLDVGEEGGQPYLVMPLVRGRPLAERLHQEGPLEPSLAARIARDLALALAHAHAQGVLHRDLKPSNVLQDERGAPLVIDFGLARETERGESRLSLTGMFLGTPGYWAPEQARGDWDRVGPLADVYALGATLYACLTGVPPIPVGDSLVDALQLTEEHQPEPPSRIAAGVDRELDAIVLRCLAKAPTDRFQDMAALAAALDGWLRQRASPAPRPLAAQRAALALLLAGLCVAVALVALRRAPAAASLTTDPEWSEALAANRTGRSVEAEALARSRLERAPADPRARLVLGFALLGQRRYDEARQVLESLEPAPGDRVLLARARGHARLKLDDMDGALEDLQRVVAEGEPTYSDWAGLAAAHAARREWSAALEAAERSLALQPDDAGALQLRGFARGHLGDSEGAMADLDRSVELEPGQAASRILRGQQLVRLGRTEEALEDYREAKRLQQPTPELHVFIGLMQLQLHLSRPRAVLDVARTAVELYPDALDIWPLRARARWMLGDPGGALEDMTYAVERASQDDPYPLWARAQLLVDLGKVRAAHFDLRAALNLALAKDPALVPQIEALLAECERRIEEGEGEPR